MAVTTMRTYVVDPGASVRLHLAIRLADGTEVLSSFGGDPLEVSLGAGTLAPGLEALLIGLSAGADERFLVDGSALYGPREASKIHWLPRADLPPDFPLVRGRLVAFDAPGGQELAGLVLEIEADRVQVDFNHPLAGRSLQIHVRILDPNLDAIGASGGDG